MKDKSRYKCLLVVTAKEKPRLLNSFRPVYAVSPGCSLLLIFLVYQKSLISIFAATRSLPIFYGVILEVFVYFESKSVTGHVVYKYFSSSLWLVF